MSYSTDVAMTFLIGIHFHYGIDVKPEVWRYHVNT